MTYDHIVNNFHKDRISELLKLAPPDSNTRAELAQLLGVSPQTINQMEEGGYEPTLHMAFKLAAAFQVPLENLFSDNPKVTMDGPNNA